MVSEGLKQSLPSGPSTLCFSKEEFMKDDFHVEDFIVACRRKVAMETLRDDLGIYLKILQSAMIELINKDYADFVNLSTNLVGMDKAISNLSTPLQQLQDEIRNVQKALDEAAAAVEAKHKKQAEIRHKKVELQRLMNILHSVEKIERLLGIKAPDGDDQHGIQYTSELSGQLTERVATEFNKLQFYVNKSRGLPLVEKIKPRIANITTVLQYSLQGSFRDGLESGNIDILRQCLRTYATIDKMKDAENLFRQYIVKPYMEELISEQTIQEEGMQGMYQLILDFIPAKCSKLKEVTSGSPQGGEVVRGYDFLVNAVWPEIVCNIEARTPSIFAPGNPETFHAKYSASLEFVSQFELQCGTHASIKRLRAHPSYNTFMSKWSLPVYFQIRFQDIAGAFETALTDPYAKSTGEEFHLAVTETVWHCLQRCWQSDVYLSALCHRFWKLTLQLLSRYATWMIEVQETQLRSTDPSEGDNGMKPDQVPNQDTVGTDTVSEDTAPTMSLSQLVLLIMDSQQLSNKIPKLYKDVISPHFADLQIENSNLLTESLEESGEYLQRCIPKFGDHIVEDLTKHSAVSLKCVSDIPRLYRRTNREVPTKASIYVMSLVKPLKEFVTSQQGVLEGEFREKWVVAILQNITEQYYQVTSDVLTSVKKMEESLRRLKRSKTTAGDLKQMGHGGMSDDDKMRIQLYLDIVEFGRQIDALGVQRSSVADYAKIQKLVETAKNTNLSS